MLTRGASNQYIDWYSDGGAPVINELTQAGRFVAQATGTAESPSWKIFAAGPVTAAHFGPLLSEDAATGKRLRELGARAAELEMDDFDAAALIAEILDRGTFSDIPFDEVGDFGRQFLDAYADTKDSGGLGWPDWAAIPVVEIAVVDQLPITVVDDRALDVNDLARRHLIEATDGQIVDALDGADIVFSEQVLELAKGLTDRAGRILNSILSGAPLPTFVLGTPNGWFAGEPPHWTAVESHSRMVVELCDLSTAQQRWATLSIALAVQQASDDALPVLFLCDEPEMGLHRSAEEALPSGLSAVAREADAAIVVATHSAPMLNAWEVEKLYVARAPKGASTCRPLRDVVGTTWGDRDRLLEQLGLTPADILQLVRVFVVVEGAHDQAIIESLLAEDLRDATASVIATGGAKSLPSVAEASLIWDYTDADVVVVLDNIAASEVVPLWDRARDAASRGSHKEAQQALYELERLPGGEPRWLREFLSRTLAAGDWERLHVAPLKEPDIVCYLPPDELGLAETWDQLIADWRRSSNGAARDLKGWIKENRRVRIPLTKIKKAVASAVPTRDMQDLGLAVRLASARRAFPS